jgi:hypothetical protein
MAAFKLLPILLELLSRICFSGLLAARRGDDMIDQSPATTERLFWNGVSKT